MKLLDFIDKPKHEKQVKKFKKELKKYKKKYLPKKYNQLELLDELCNPEIDFYLSITNRGDGKSFNYPSSLLYLSYHLDIGVTFVVRHFTLQQRIRELVEEILVTLNWYDVSQLWFRNTDDYIVIGLGEKEIAIITDLNNASDLKYSSQVLKDFPIIVYDEFLALSGDYIANEYEKLQMIYRSIDRLENRDYIIFPKVILLGNPVNFESPILPNLKLYNALENQEINTIKQYGNKLLELRRNDNVNDTKNLRAFADEEDSNVTGQFNYSKFLLVSENEYDKLSVSANFARIDISNNLSLKVINNQDETILSIEKLNGDETYCIELKDETDKKQFLTENYYNNRFHKKYEKNLFKYKDSFSKTFIQSNDSLMSLNFFKCLSTNNNTIQNEEVYTQRKQNEFLKKLAERYE